MTVKKAARMPRSIGTIAVTVFCVVACASRSDGDDDGLRPLERVGAVSQRLTSTVVHTFSGGPGDGAGAYGPVVLSGSTLYGTTLSGGAAGRGTVFKVNADGTGFALLHSFAGKAGDGADPYESLVLSGSTLYGMTRNGGAADRGTVFKIDTDGAGFALLHSFAGGPGDGAFPSSSLAVSGSTLYGMTRDGGAAHRGTVFKVEMDGTAFALLHSFSGSSSDGAYPFSSVAVSGSTLYGTTTYGGAADLGTVFKMGTDGTGFALLHSFAGAPGDGGTPYASVVVSGSTLYGTTRIGGATGRGTVFKVDTDGTGFALLRSFAGGAGDGAWPYPSVLLSGSTLYGTTYEGGAADHGTVFKMDTNGTGFALLYSFAGRGDGGRPRGSVVLSGSTLYGTTLTNVFKVLLTCMENEYVSNHDCVPCAPGSTRPAGDLATGGDTACAATACAVNEYVSNHACIDCAPGGTRPPGDLATGPDTACANTVVCAANEYVSNHACVPCAPGSTRPAGDPAIGSDTTCADTLCAADEHVESHTCVSCPPGTTRPAGDPATGADTACTGLPADSGAPPGSDAGSSGGNDGGVSSSSSGGASSGGSSSWDASSSSDASADDAFTSSGSAGSADTGDAGGCTVTTPGASHSPAAGISGLGVLVLVGARRRRRSSATGANLE